MTDPSRWDPEYLERRLKLVLAAIEQVRNEVREVLEDISDDGGPDNAAD